MGREIVPATFQWPDDKAKQGPDPKQEKVWYTEQAWVKRTRNNGGSPLLASNPEWTVTSSVTEPRRYSHLHCSDFSIFIHGSANLIGHDQAEVQCISKIGFFKGQYFCFTNVKRSGHSNSTILTRSIRQITIRTIQIAQLAPWLHFYLFCTYFGCNDTQFNATISATGYFISSNETRM
jgi:hypothetical protein